MWFQKPRAIQFNRLDFLLATLAVVGCVAICEVLILMGAVRGYGGVFWIPVVWASQKCSLAIGLWAAALGCSVYYLLYVPPRFEIGTDLIGYIVLLASMMSVAMSVSSEAHTRRALVRITPDDYAEACARGERNGAEFLKMLSFGRQFFVLGWTVREMIQKGSFSGDEVGFFHTISQALLNELPPNHTPEDLNGQGWVVDIDRKVVADPVCHEQ